MHRIALALATTKASVWRNNVGQGWQGKATFEAAKGGQSRRMILENARPIKFGLCEGSSDFIGLTRVTITPEMVGKTVAIFTAIEVKHGTKPTPEQLNFIEFVRSAGGFAGIAHNDAEALAIIEPNLFP